MEAVEVRYERDRGPSSKLLKLLLGLSPDEFWKWAEATNQPDETIRYLFWWLDNGHIYHERPVDVRTFFFSPAYMRLVDETGEPTVWPEVVRAAEDICTGNFIEALMTGAIGSAKTTLAILIQAYEVYKLLCLKNPHLVLGIMPGHEILTIFQSLDLQKARDVDYIRFKEMIDAAPIFSDEPFRYDRDIRSEMRFSKNILVRPVSGLETATLGLNVIGGVIDELDSMAVVAKSARSRDDQTYDQAVRLYNSIQRRRLSRFMKQGVVLGMLCLVSSKQYTGAFTDRKEEEARNKPEQIYVYNRRVWEVKPWDFGKERFRMFVGDAARQPRILEPDEEVEDKDRDLVHEVPVEYREQFEEDPIGNIRDVLGISTLAIHPYIVNRDAIARAFGRRRSVASRPECDFINTRLDLYPGRWAGTEQYPRFAHLDLARSQDSAGLAIGYVPRFRRIRRTKLVTEVLPVVKIDLLLEILPPRGGEIQYEKIRRLLYLLREHGLPLKWVTADQYQSTDMLQILTVQGFIVGEDSTDKTPAPYEVLKTALYDGRVIAPEHLKAQTELTRLERDPVTGKIDHPPDGSKDVADSLACVVFGLSLMAEIWHQHGVDLHEIPLTLSQHAEQHHSREVDGRL
jgi:hypothetical protein